MVPGDVAGNSLSHNDVVILNYFDDAIIHALSAQILTLGLTVRV